MQRVNSQSDQVSYLELLHGEPETARLDTCPDCQNKLFFQEAAFLCPVCGYSMETVYS